MLKMESHKGIASRHFTDWRFPVILFFVFRLGLWGWMVLVRTLIPLDISPDEIVRPYLGIAPERITLLEVWQRWDVLHYQSIALNGYDAQNLEPFAPIYPLLMRIGAALTANNTMVSGLLVSSIFCLAAFYAMFRLARMEMGTSEPAQKALLYLALFPTAFFLFAPYSEPVFLCGAILSIKSLRERKWLAAGLWGLLAASSRLPGALLVLPALYEAWMDWRKTKLIRTWMAPALILAGTGLFPVYLWVTESIPPWSIFQTQNSAYHRNFCIPGVNLWYAIKNIFNGIYPLVNAADLVFAVLFIAGTVMVWKRLSTVYGIYMTAFMLLYLGSSTVPYPLYSISRFTLVLFPVFLLLPKLIQDPKKQLAVMGISLAGLLFYSAQFAIWGWAG